MCAAEEQTRLRRMPYQHAAAEGNRRRRAGETPLTCPRCGRHYWAVDAAEHGEDDDRGA